jgi:hypothetical protein
LSPESGAWYAPYVLSLALSSVVAAAPRGPQPGEVYREFASHQGGNDWRVTNPEAKEPRARKHLPNPALPLRIDSLEGAVRAEAVLDRWGGHVGTKRPQIRFNDNAWLDVPPPLDAPGQGNHERYYFQDNPVTAVPLKHLKAGDNTFQGTCSHENPTGWGQWGLYSLILRVYYEPTAGPHPAGRIVSPAQDATIGENPTVRIEASSPSGVARVDVLAWYEGYDENGDGVWLDWHGGHFQPVRGYAADLRDHVGTLWRSPYELTWDTRWVPDQPSRAVQLIARIQDSRGTWFVTQPVTGLTLRRQGQSVRLYRTAEVPARFGVRNHATRSCVIPIGSDQDLSRALEAGLHYRTWHGWDGHHKPFRLNDLVHANEGKNHHFDYDIHLIPPAALRTGDNVFTIRSETEEHMLEVHWPGPALTVRFRTGDGS